MAKRLAPGSLRSSSICLGERASTEDLSQRRTGSVDSVIWRCWTDRAPARHDAALAPARLEADTTDTAASPRVTSIDCRAAGDRQERRTLAHLAVSAPCYVAVTRSRRALRSGQAQT